MVKVTILHSIFALLVEDYFFTRDLYSDRSGETF